MAKRSREEIEREIIKILKKHPEGLTIGEIGKLVGIARANVVKYLYRLAGAGVLNERCIGPAKLYSLKVKS